MKSVAMVGVAIGIAIAAPYLAPYLASALTISTAVATAIVTVGLGLVAGVAMKALGLTAKVGAPSAKNGTPTVYRQTIADSNIVYGQRRVGGLLTFFHATHVANNYFRYFVIAVAGHRVQGVLRWYLGDEAVLVDETGLVTSGTYAGKAWLWFESGMEDAAAHGVFVAECAPRWTDDHRGRGIAKIYAKFSLTDEIVQAGMPNITCEIEGKDDIRDPRTDAVGYTNNASLVFYDWMAMPREEGGFGAYADEIPDDSWIAAQANVCDEDVLLLEGGSEKRYTLDGVIVTGAAPDQVRDTLVINCAGTFASVGGQFLMRPGYWVPASASLSEGDLAGPITVSAFTSGNEIANEVQGTYVEPASLYQAAPFKTQAQPLADPRQMDLDLAFVTSKSRATRIGRIMLRRALSEKTVAWPMNVAGLAVQAMDTVQLDTNRYGLANYAWTVGSWKMSQDFGVVLSLREESPEIYDWDPSESPALPPHVPVARPTPIPMRYSDGTPIEELKPAEAGATAGMSPSEAERLAQLEADSEAGQMAFAAAEAEIDQIQADAAIVRADIISLGGEVLSIGSTVAAQGVDITQNSLAISNLNGQLAELDVTVSAGKPNLLTNGDFANGTTGWSDVNGVLSSFDSPSVGRVGRFDITGSLYGGTYRDVPVEPGVDYYLSAEGDPNGIADAGIILRYMNADKGTTLLETDKALFTDWDHRKTVHAVAPPGAAWARLIVNGTGPGFFFFSRVMMQRAGATQWQDQASVRTINTAVSSLSLSYAQLSQTVTTQGAVVSTNALAISNLQSQVGSYNIALSVGRPNMLVNGDFSNGFDNWGTINNTAYYYDRNQVGSYASMNGLNGNDAFIYQDVPVYPGSSYSFSYEGDQFGTNAIYGEYWIGHPSMGGTHSGTYIFSGPLVSWATRVVSPLVQAPPGADWMRIVFRANAGNNGLNFSRVMLVANAPATGIWQDQATVRQQFSALNTLNSQYASLSSTVSVQGVTVSQQSQAISTLNGNVAALFGRIALTVDVGGRVTGIEVNGTPQAGGIKLHADYFSIEKPGGGARFEYSGGNMRVYDPNNVLRFRAGVW